MERAEGGGARIGGGAPSLARRLALSIALVLALGGAGAAAAALAYGREAAQRAYDRLLVGAADQIAGSISLSEGRIAVDIPRSAFDLLALAPDDRVVYAVFGPDGALVTGYDRPDLRRAAPGFFDAAFAGEPARVVSVHRRFAERAFDGTVEVVVGQTGRARAELAREIARGALVVVGAVGLLMAGLVVFAIRSALGPLRRIEDGLAARAPQDLTPLDLAAPREIGQLVGAINRFMARQARQVEIMRNLIADASHQLRTPVAALRAQAELAAEETDPARQRAIVARVHARAVGMSRLTDQLLNHALIIHRADAAPRERIDLRAAAMRAVEECGHDAGGGEVGLELPEEPVICRGDALSLAEACKNLLGNALRHGAPPVVVEVRGAAGAGEIVVRDAGPGMPEALWADAGARFARTSGVTPDGAGLGLAIVASVARAHDGTLRFGRDAAGGFAATLALPLSTQDGSEDGA